MIIHPNRLRTLTEARNNFSVVVAEAQAGLTTHVVKGSALVAHVVPATARIVDSSVLNDMIGAVVNQAAAAVEGDVRPASIEGEGLRRYVAALSDHVDDRARITTTDELLRALAPGLGGLDEGEWADLRSTLQSRSDVFEEVADAKGAEVVNRPLG